MFGLASPDAALRLHRFVIDLREGTGREGKSHRQDRNLNSHLFPQTDASWTIVKAKVKPFKRRVAILLDSTQIRHVFNK
jgi:hypothetical protein